MVLPGSLAVSVEQIAPDGFTTFSQGVVSADGLTTTLTMDNDPEIGKYSWKGGIFATDFATERALVFPINEQSFSVVEEVDIEAARLAKEAELEQQRRIKLEKQLIAQREADRKRSMIIIAVGNVIAIILGLIVWFVWRKLKAKRDAMPEMQLEVPKK